MIDPIINALLWAWCALKWLSIAVFTALVAVATAFITRTNKVADISMIHCVNVIAQESNLTLWEEQLKAEKADIIERESALEARSKKR